MNPDEEDNQSSIPRSNSSLMTASAATASGREDLSFICLFICFCHHLTINIVLYVCIRRIYISLPNVTVLHVIS